MIGIETRETVGGSRGIHRSTADGWDDERRAPRPRPLDAAVLFLVGFTPITTLAAALLELVPLHRAAPVTIAIAVTVAAFLVISRPDLRRTIGGGLAAGLLAVLVYDGTRLPFVVLGDWPDFIPRIGDWLRNAPDVHWSIGYLWRYLGNGAGMGLAFTAISRHSNRVIDPRAAGPAFGIAVWTGLLITLALSPDGQTKMFVLTPATFALSLIGHLVYGGVLGLCAWRSKVAAIRARRRTSSLAGPTGTHLRIPFRANGSAQPDHAR